MEIILREIVAALFFTIGGYIATSNGILIWNWFVHQKRSSTIPFLAGTLGMIGYMIMPTENKKWWWIPFVIDPASLPGVMCLVAFLTIRGKKVVISKHTKTKDIEATPDLNLEKLKSSTPIQSKPDIE